MKPFSTVESQIEILKSRGLIFQNEERAAETLKFENYYNIVNGYKRLLLDLEKSNEQSDYFLEGSSFEELYSLFQFDRNLKMLFMRAFIMFENHFKSVMVYEFSKMHSEKNAYLDEANYKENLSSYDQSKLKNTIQMMQRIIDEQKKHDDNAISHYCKKYDENIPFWVFINFAPLGMASHLYKYMDERLRNEIAFEFYNVNKENYVQNSRLLDKTLERIVFDLSEFRNICAHDLTLYNAYRKRRPQVKQLESLFGYMIPPLSLRNTNLFIVYLQLKVVLKKEEFNHLKSSLMKIFDEISIRLQTIDIEDVLNAMQFPKEWDRIV